jgi:DNA end-binding protein Ku
MPRKKGKKSRKSASSDDSASKRTRDGDDGDLGPRSLWTGTISFGLVSVPVHVLPGNRTTRKGLRMLASDGTPLQRRYFCPREDVVLDWDDIVRGYEIEDEKYVVVTDEELEGLEPKKSREIELTRFVDLSAIDPMYFERAYFLAPGQGGGHAYRLLTDAMESTGKAGIATFVMREKEYLVAIVSEKGVLRAEILRFSDEVRSLGDVGLSKPVEPKPSTVKAFKDVLKRLTKTALDPAELTDDTAAALDQLAAKKARSRKNVVTTSEEVPETENAPVIDLLEVLKQTLAKEMGTSSARSGSHRAANANAAAADDSKEALYERAKSLGIEGRSKMSRKELLAAIRHAS